MSTPTKEEIIKAVDALQDNAVEILSQLVRMDSTLGMEAASKIQDHMAKIYAELGLEVDKFEISLDEIKNQKGFSPVDWSYAGKENVVGVHKPKSQGKGRSLILNGHVDVVPTGPSGLWSVTGGDPFNATVKDGRLYGRGCGDMKAGVVAAIIAVKALRSLGFAPASKLIMESVLEEECTGNGTLACLARGYTADAVVIPEPFPFITTAQLGVMWARVIVTGRPAHVLDTSAGMNAIEAAYKMFGELKAQLETEWNDSSLLPSDYLGQKHPVNLNLGVIEGGEWPSSVPTVCTFDVRVGIPPAITMEKARERFQELLLKSATTLGVKHTIVYRGFQAEGAVVDKNGDMMQLLGSAHQKVLGTPAKYAPLTCTTDARFFSLYHNIPATCFGPEAQNIHGINESVSLSSMRDVARVLAVFIAEWCGLEPK